jgi:hypothetical protein
MQHHLDLGEQRRRLLRQLERRARGIERGAAFVDLREPRVPAPRLRCSELHAGEMRVQCVAQRARFVCGQRKRLGRHHDELVVDDAKMHRVGARPGLLAGIRALRSERQRACRIDAFAEVKRVLHPAFQALRLLRAAAAAPEQELERGEARRSAAAEETGDEELAVHQGASGTTRTPRLPRWRERIR